MNADEMLAFIANGAYFNLHCGDCDVDTSTGAACEYYFVRDKLWRKHHGGKLVLCVGCFEKRLRRRLRHGDFNWEAPANHARIPRSDRLRDRMTKGGLAAATKRVPS